jgi:hypothetical protein
MGMAAVRQKARHSLADTDLIRALIRHFGYETAQLLL